MNDGVTVAKDITAVQCHILAHLCVIFAASFKTKWSMPQNDNPKGRILNEFSYCWPIFSARHPTVPYPSVEVKKLAPHIGGRTSSSGQITFNVLLGDISTDSIRHVIFHELCHLIHHNHSREFYNTLDKLDPLHQKRNGAYLEKKLQNLENLIETINIQ